MSFYSIKGSWPDLTPLNALLYSLRRYQHTYTHAILQKTAHKRRAGYKIHGSILVYQVFHL